MIPPSRVTQSRSTLDGAFIESIIKNDETVINNYEENRTEEELVLRPIKETLEIADDQISTSHSRKNNTTRNIYKVERRKGQSNEFFKVMVTDYPVINDQNEDNSIEIGCINFNANVFLLAKSALEMNCYLLIFSFSVLPQTFANIYYRNCGEAGDCFGFYSLTAWCAPLRLFGHIFPPAIAWYRIKKK